MKEQEVTANMVTKYLGQFAYEVLEPLGIEYRTKRTGKSRLIKFLCRDGDDTNDAGIAICYIRKSPSQLSLPSQTEKRG